MTVVRHSRHPAAPCRIRYSRTVARRDWRTLSCSSSIERVPRELLASYEEDAAESRAPSLQDR